MSNALRDIEKDYVRYIYVMSAILDCQKCLRLQTYVEIGKKKLGGVIKILVVLSVMFYINFNIWRLAQ